MRAISEEPPLTLAEAASRGVPRVPKAAGAATVPSVGFAKASAT
jgi:hypothetical protein